MEPPARSDLLSSAIRSLHTAENTDRAVEGRGHDVVILIAKSVPMIESTLSF